MTGESAPIVYDEDGNPMRVRVVGAECEGDVSGTGHFAYRRKNRNATDATVWFEAVNDGE